FIASYILDKYIEADSRSRVALEVQLKERYCTISGEITSNAPYGEEDIADFAREAIDKIGYTDEYQERFGDSNTICAEEVEVETHISRQSQDISQGVDRDSWGDQGLAFGYAVDEPEYGYMPKDYWLARKLGQSIAGVCGGLDVKTQVTLVDGKPVECVVAIPLAPGDDEAAVVEVADQARARMRRAARELGDLADGAYATLAECEGEYTRFLKMVILPPAAIREDLVAQSNAWQDVEAFNNRPWQGEALDYTRAFRQKFPAWAQAYEQQAQSDTNKPPFTAEAQAKVSALSTELEKIQIECAKAPDPTLQEKALDIIREIMELLPKDGGGGGQQNQQQKDQDKNSPNNDDRKSDDKQDPGQQPETPEDQDLGQQDENPQQEKPEDQKDEEKPGADESEEDKDVEALLKKALERSAEHEAEKKARMYRAPRNDSDRDW
ncbi:MAG: hypothetical protein IIY62_07385, partial [Kiritimatiellae bacterium]|nr:hypothetical protein [Kiritimatiellia bacterium]